MLSQLIIAVREVNYFYHKNKDKFKILIVDKTGIPKNKKQKRNGERERGRKGEKETGNKK